MNKGVVVGCCQMWILLLEELLHQLIGSLSHIYHALYMPDGAGFLSSTVPVNMSVLSLDSKIACKNTTAIMSLNSIDNLKYFCFSIIGK